MTTWMTTSSLDLQGSGAACGSRDDITKYIVLTMNCLDYSMAVTHCSPRWATSTSVSQLSSKTHVNASQDSVSNDQFLGTWVGNPVYSSKEQGLSLKASWYYINTELRFVTTAGNQQWSEGEIPVICVVKAPASKMYFLCFHTSGKVKAG